MVPFMKYRSRNKSYSSSCNICGIVEDLLRSRCRKCVRGANDRGSVLSPLRTVRPPKKLAAGPSGNGSWENSPDVICRLFHKVLFTAIQVYHILGIVSGTGPVFTPHPRKCWRRPCGCCGAGPFHRARLVLRRLPAFALSQISLFLLARHFR